MTADRRPETTTDEVVPNFLEIIGAADKADPKRQAAIREELAHHRRKRARRDPAVTAALRARFGVTTSADAA